MFNAVKIENHFHLHTNQKWWNPLNWLRKKWSKDNVRILFVDDTEMPVVDNLKFAGYKVKRVRDIRNIDDAELKDSQVIFVDYDGVGRIISPKHQGAGLVKEIKNTYGSGKFVVLYTAEPKMPTDTAMNDMFKSADGHMRKNADTTDFIDKINHALTILK